jgi:hypothetical protein
VPSAPNPVASGAGSIVFIKADDVWLAAPDGSAARQLTHDGSQTGYHDPSQAPDGSIFVLQGRSQLVRLDRSSGTPLGAAVTLPTLENGAEGLTVAPDGAHVAYTTTGYGTEVDPRFGTPTGTFIYGGTDVATPDGTSVPNAAIPSAVFPSWINATDLAVADGVKVYFDRVGQAPQVWVDKSEGCLIDLDCPPGQAAAANLSDPAVSRDGTLLAYISKPYYGDGGRFIARVTSAPPAAPTDMCLLAGQQNHSDPGSFAPDGRAIAYDDTMFDPNTFESSTGQGIYVLTLDLNSADCGAARAVLAIPGGAQPDWGPLAP